MRLLISGDDRALLPWHLHGGGRPQDPGPGLRAPPRQLPQKRLEHHGLHCRGHGVSEKEKAINVELSL